LQQFQQFLGGGGTFNPATSLFVVWLFPNDVSWATATNSLPTPIPNSPGGANVVANGIANILTLVQTLAALGGQNFLVPNMPDLGLTPEYLGTPVAPELSQLTALFNANLKSQLALLDAGLPTAKISYFDTAAALAAIVGNPPASGFTNVTEQCVQNLLNGRCDPGSWLFWDGVHPTTFTHRFLASQFRAAVPEPGALALVAVALAMLLAQGMHRARGDA
jgi:phospholipase/lecithinase/hemolysin